jgi:hypothetical protein
MQRRPASSRLFKAGGLEYQDGAVYQRLREKLYQEERGKSAPELGECCRSRQGGISKIREHEKQGQRERERERAQWILEDEKGQE